MSDMINLEEEKYFVSRGMAEFGGSFIASLGQALDHADLENAEKIKTAWPEYWEEYKEKGKKSHMEDQI